MALDQSLARAISRRNIADWIAAGSSFELALKKLIRLAHLELQAGRPPAKVVTKGLDQLSRLMTLSGLPGELGEIGGRRHEVTICMPEAVDDTVAFVLVSGSVNGRNGVINLMRRRVLTASQHVLERLHQRLETKDSLIVLREVYSCLVAAVAMAEAAQIAGARHWPLVTKNGLFVCAPSEDGETTVLVTWMRLDQLGRKWGRVADHIRAANSENSQLLHDTDFNVELLRLHAWLLRPHAPGQDMEALWWASRPLSEQDDAVRDLEESLADQDIDDESELASAGEEAELVSEPLPNDKAGQVHLVKARERYTGIVAQVRSTGTRVVGLRNGCFGVLRHGDCAAAAAVGVSTAALKLGARISVEVLRVAGDVYTGAHCIVLQLPEVADAIWSAVQERHSVESIVEGSIVWRGVEGCVIALPDGATGWLPYSELSWHDEGAVRRSLVFGQELRLQVTGYAQDYRRLLLSLREAEGHPVDWSIIAVQYPVGAMVDGCIVWRGTGGFAIRLPDGTYGWLDDAELSWSAGDRSVRDLLAIGQIIQLRVVKHKPARRKLMLSLRQVGAHPLDGVEESTFVGTMHTGVVSKVVDYGLFVRLPIGVDGLLHRSHFPEGLSPSEGDVLRVQVMSMEGRRVGLDYVHGTA